ncbi:hypothetical protein PQZ11_06270 [Luminiphilus sp.]|nr:hypothetical protein [Luminiphilus sp.]MDC6472653.1 hypothetical protein [Luminiphilus sp.]
MLRVKPEQCIGGKATQLRPPAFFLAGLLFLLNSAALEVSGQILDDTANAKLLSVHSKTLLINDQYFEDLLRGYGLPSGADEIQEEYLTSAQCGSVNIGNNFASNQISGEITVIIVGDILNVGNTCGG